MAASDLIYMAKSQRKTKEDYIDDLNVIVFEMAKKLKVKQIRQLLAKYALS